MHSEDERYHSLGMDPLVIKDALVVVRTQKTNVIMVSAWIQWLSDALGTRTSLWFGPGCSGYWMYSEREIRNTRYYGLGMDALVNVCIRNTNIIVVLGWMLQ